MLLDELLDIALENDPDLVVTRFIEEVVAATYNEHASRTEQLEDAYLVLSVYGDDLDIAANQLREAQQ